VRVIPSCLRFAKMYLFVPGKSPIEVQPEILDFFLEELHTVYMDREPRFFSCSECDLDPL
jgi:hypothetical protein